MRIKTFTHLVDPSISAYFRIGRVRVRVDVPNIKERCIFILAVLNTIDRKQKVGVSEARTPAAQNSSKEKRKSLVIRTYKRR